MKMKNKARAIGQNISTNFFSSFGDEIYDNLYIIKINYIFVHNYRILKAINKALPQS